MHITTISDTRGNKTSWKQNKEPKLYRHHSPFLFLYFISRAVLKMENFISWKAKKKFPIKLLHK
jgi:hypothetical protein